MMKFSFKEIQSAATSDMLDCASLMRAYKCSGYNADVAKRIMGAIIDEDFSHRFGDRDKLTILLRMLFDAGFQAGMSVDEKVKASQGCHNHRGYVQMEKL